MEDENKAKAFLDKLLSQNLLNRLMTLESEQKKKYQNSKTDVISQLILKCPDQFYAVAIMQKNPVYFGRGDF